MKKIVVLVIILFMTLSIIPSFVFATESNLIQNVQMNLKSAESPKRLEVNFNLTEPINLSQGSSNIIFEYFTTDSNGNLELTGYKKDKSWSGYLNSYENYPSDERKYSSGTENNTAYSDNVPATIIYTSTRTSASIDVTLVTAIRITVLRADGSGEKVTIYNNGTTSAIEKIEIPVTDKYNDTGIRLESTTAELPINTILIANELTSGPVYERIIAVLDDVRNFIAFEIKLESDNVEIQPDGKVKISIPIPEDFNNTDLMVYRIDNDGTKLPYSVTITTKESTKYVTFETDHFSIYVLAEVIEKEEIVEIEEIEKINEAPKTGETQTIYYYMVIIILSLIGIAAYHKKSKVNKI